MSDGTHKGKETPWLFGFTRELLVAALPWLLPPLAPAEPHFCLVSPGGNGDFPNQPVKAETTNSSATKHLCKGRMSFHLQSRAVQAAARPQCPTASREQQGFLLLYVLREVSRETTLLRGGELMCLKTTPQIAFCFLHILPYNISSWRSQKSFSQQPTLHWRNINTTCCPAPTDMTKKLFLLSAATVGLFPLLALVCGNL